VASPPHICQLALTSASASCSICSCLPWLVVVLSPVNLQLCNHHPPLPLPPMVGCCIFRLLRCLSLLLRSLSSPCTIASYSASLGPLIRLVVASHPSCPSGCCIPSPHADTFHLWAPPSLIAPLPLVMPLSMSLPLVPLVHLVVASPLLMLAPPICRRLCLPLCQRLSSCHGLPCLLSGWLLHCCLYSHHCLPSACNSASHCAIASCHAPLHVIASHASSQAGCCVASPHPPNLGACRNVSKG
jgi:hypothetical protein